MEKLINDLLDNLPKLGISVLILVIGILLSKLVIKIFARAVSKSHIDATVNSFIQSFTRVVLYSIVIVISLDTAGVPMTTIIAILGAAGLAVSLALQNSLSNLAGGFIILFSRPIKVGDFIETNGILGTVNMIGILYTRLLTPDNKVIYIPNGQISSATLINYNQQDKRRLDLTYSISYNDNFEEAIKIIKNILNSSNLCLSDPEPIVRVCEHAANSINIAVKVWVDPENYWDLNFYLNEQILVEFKKSNISIPYNQLDVNIISQK